LDVVNVYPRSLYAQIDRSGIIRANPYTLPSDIPRPIKGRSSHDLRQEFPHLRKLPSLWTRSFFLSTAGDVSQEIIQNYIERQSKT
jgi:putative transposase